MADVEKKSKDKIKKPFDKKKWRERHHSTKYKIQKWKEERKKALEHRYKKQLKKEGIELKGSVADRQQQQKISRIKEAQLEFERRKEEIEADRKKRQELNRVVSEMRAKKAERHKKLNQKTHKGQPLMRARLELLQEKIQMYVNTNKL